MHHPAVHLRHAVVLVVLGTVACANGEGFGRRDGGGPAGDVGVLDVGSGLDAAGLDARGLDAPMPTDTGRADARLSDAGATDAGRVDAGRDAGGGGGGLDPDLDTPPASATPCSTPGGMSDCPGIAVCRFFSATEGRCESCTECGNLGDPCTEGTDCDILFACFEGRCTNICPLGTFYCGPVEDCLNVGHPTHGVCRP